MNARDGYIVARNTARVLADSRRLDDIQEVGEIVSRTRMRELVGELRRTEDGLRLLTERPEINTRQVDYAALRTLPPDTLGYAYAHHLRRHDLDPDKLNRPTPAATDSDQVYLARRLNGAHDIWHALLGLGVAGHEEVLLHAFTHGQLRIPVSALIVGFGALKHMVLERRWRTLFVTLRELHALGRDAPDLTAVRWEQLWDRPLDEVRRRFRLLS